MNKNKQFPQSHLFQEKLTLQNPALHIFPMLLENIEFKVRKITYIQVTTILEPKKKKKKKRKRKKKGIKKNND